MGYISSPMLFTEIEEKVSPQTRKAAAISERRRKAKQAYDATSEAWKKATYRFAVERFLPQTVVFLFEELTTAYNEAAKTEGLPLTVNGKAFAGLQRRLIKEGKIAIFEGYSRLRSNGQLGIVYRRIKNL